jgi:hypothetical protein
MKLRNVYSIDVISSFEVYYSSSLQDLVGNTELSIGFIDQRSPLFDVIASNFDPLATNVIIKPATIAINKDVCARLNLIEVEVSASP